MRFGTSVIEQIYKHYPRNLYGVANSFTERGSIGALEIAIRAVRLPTPGKNILPPSILQLRNLDMRKQIVYTKYYGNADLIRI